MSQISRVLRKRVKGQSMMIIGILLGLGVLIGLVAIAVDGGSALLQRRTMQNAADAGALAGIRLMSERVLISGGSGGGGYPTYALTNTLLLNTVQALINPNRQGVVGDGPVYTWAVYFHRDNETYDSTPVVPGATTYVPDHVDGIKVVSRINNPTVFARALAGPIDFLAVSAASAMALFPTCRPAPPSEPGKTLPFTRYRYSFEQELPTKANNLCDPFVFWTSQPDVSGPQQTRSFKNKISFNTRSFWDSPNPMSLNPDTEQQLLTAFDHRWYGTPVPTPTVPYPVDMRGSADTNDVDAQNDLDGWMRYQWRGEITTDTVRVDNLQGDWAETYSGDQGQNIQNPLLYQIQNASDKGWTAISDPWPQGLGWGWAITRTVYLWGQATLPSSTSAQSANPYWTCSQQNCNNICPGDNSCVWHPGWQYVNITNQGNQGPRSDANLDRVRFTDAVQIVFYENLNGGQGQARCPGGGSVPTSSNEALGVLPSAILPGPPPGGGGCGWLPGNAVYYRQINP